jgi:2'-hydroxyisoflavone reductase
MRILVLGGTVFLGRALTEAALAHGHHVTHFNRGRSAPPDARVESLQGDRAEASSMRKAFGDRRWDAVIDTSGYMPQVVRRSAEALREKAPRYVFVSTISAYASFDLAAFDEDAPLSPAPDPLPEALDTALYGPLKAGCEAAVREVYGERALIIRPGLIVGPNDPTDRFTYWAARVARGGTVLAPGRPQRPVQFIDVRDLAEWMIHLLEKDVAGTFNATGPRRAIPMSVLLESCRMVAGLEARFEWIDDAALLEAKVEPWREMPLWIPESDAAMRGLMGCSIERALAQGLKFRPLAQTLADTLAWSNKRPADHPWKAGMSAEREAQLLEALRGKASE